MLQDVFECARNTHTNLVTWLQVSSEKFLLARTMYIVFIFVICNLNVFRFTCYFSFQKPEGTIRHAPVLQRKCPAPPVLDRLIISTAQNEGTLLQISNYRTIVIIFYFPRYWNFIICTIWFDKTRGKRKKAEKRERKRKRGICRSRKTDVL